MTTPGSFPARLLGRRVPSGGAVVRACSLHACRLGAEPGRGCREPDRGGRRQEDWEALTHPGQKLKPGARVVFEGPVVGCTRGPRTAAASDGGSSGSAPRTARQVERAVDAIGHVPLPPYIRRSDTRGRSRAVSDGLRRLRGSVAAPTAGLHFSALLALCGERGVGYRRSRCTWVTAPSARSGRARRGPSARARAFRITEAAGAINNAPRPAPPGHRRRHDHDAHPRVCARNTLAASSPATGHRPVHRARLPSSSVSTGITNFHLPQSSLLVLVSAFAGRERCSRPIVKPSRAIPVL